MDPFNFDHFYLPSSPELVQSERDHIDARISQLELAVVILKKRRNFLSPVSRLSVDVLLNIFECVQNDNEDEFFNVTYPRRRASSPSFLFPLTWIRALTHVCSRWRSLALDTATLWTNITFRNNSVRYATEMLTRTRGARLSIIISLESVTQEANSTLLWNTLKAQMPRIRTLDIHAPEAWYQAHLSEFQASSALETLSVSTRFYNTITLPIQLLQLSSNTLRFLRIASVNFNTQDLHSVIVFPILSKIAMEGPAVRCAGLLSKLSFPLTCAVILRCWDDAGTFQSLTPFLTKFFQSWFAAGRRLNRLELPSRHNLAFSFSETPDVSEQALAVELVSARTSTQLIQHLLPPIALSHPTTVSLCVQELNKVVWNYLAKSCFDVDTLSLFFLEDCRPIWKSLYISRPDRKAYRQGNKEIPIVFPKLTKLELQSLDFSKESSTELRRAVISRSKIGIPLRSIRFIDTWGLRKKYPRNLEAFVDGSVEVSDPKVDEPTESGDEEDSSFSSEDVWMY
ncbi:hypothetical protein BDN72DRAFT_851031 [Pluteus cervinus]|uniref:Uncharacterized protein n=1 Tax=Pluteus cervinus TaxID=181527 RepID=A0ACD3A2F6_9AGAR|nr:hypothetical protein BDN72DRAFT_851031 [Pluteus cervinus]